MKYWAGLLFIISALFIGNYAIKPSSMPARGELFPPHSDSELRVKANSYKNRPDIVSKYMDLFLKDPQSELSMLWWAKYRKAQALTKARADEACQIYDELSEDKRFPLHALAQINSEKLCQSKITEPDQKLAELEGEVLDAKLDVAEKEDSPEAQIEALVQKSKASVIYEEKIQLMKDAIDIATKSKVGNITELETRLYRLSPSLMPKPPRSKYLEVAYDLSKRRLFKQARVYYRKITRDSRFSLNSKIAAYKGMAQSYKLQLDRERTLRTHRDMDRYVYDRFKTRGFARWECRVYDGVNILYARTQWTQHKAGDGKRTLKKLVKACGRKISLEQAYWILGRMAEEKGDFKTAILEYRKAKKDANPKSQLYKKILWNLAWADYKTNDYKESIENIKTLTELESTGLTSEKYRFWMAMAHKKAGDKEAAEEQFHQLIEDTPLSFYSYLAQRELGLKLKKTELLAHLSEQEMTRPPYVLLDYFDELYFEWLIALNEKDIAKDYLNGVSQSLRGSKESDNLTAWVYVLNQFARLDSHATIFQKLGALEDGLRQEIFHNYHHLIFPMPFNEEVMSSSARFGVRAEYIYAIMRQESAFNPRARSHMDAFGLMQLLPEVAKVTADKHGINFNGPEDLYDPETSIMIGTSHLKELLDRYKGNLVLAIASYNANERAIRNWMATRYNGDTLEFIEDIPYEETSNYVKLVLRNLYTYTLFKSKDTQAQFPEWSLAMSPTSN